jgi:hypothetical protein
LLIASLVLNWAIPFVILLPRWTKKRAAIMGAVAAIALAGHWLDLYVAILPPSGVPSAPVMVCEFGSFLGAMGLFGLLFFFSLHKSAIVPTGDPYLSDRVSAALGDTKETREPVTVRDAAYSGR